MANERENFFFAPVFLGGAFFLFVLAFIEKGLNLLGGTVPWLSVYPRQLLEWAVTLLVFEIALLLRQHVTSPRE